MKSSSIGVKNMIIQSYLVMLWAYICIKLSMKYEFICMVIKLLIVLCGFFFRHFYDYYVGICSFFLFCGN